MVNMNPRAEKTLDYRHHGWTQCPYCPTCDATTGQPHDHVRHAERFADVLGTTTEPGAYWAAFRAFRQAEENR
jgi:hypothetical protein